MRRCTSLFGYLQLLPDLPFESLAYHQTRNDFSAWAGGVLGDAELAAHLRKPAHRQLTREIGCPSADGVAGRSGGSLE